MRSNPENADPDQITERNEGGIETTISPVNKPAFNEFNDDAIRVHSRQGGKRGSQRLDSEINSQVNSSIYANPLDSARYKAFEDDPLKVLGVVGT